MIYGFSLLFIVIFWALLTYRQGGPFCYIPIFLILVLFGGLRGKYVGADGSGYVDRFEKTEGMSAVAERMVEETGEDEITLKSIFSEPAIALINVIAKVISSNYAALFCIIAAIVVGAYLKSFQKFSENLPISLFVLLAMGDYFSFFNGARQGMAAAIYTLSFGALIDRNFKKYCLWILFAMMFHRSIFFAIPLYFLFTRPNNFRQNLLIFAIGLFCIFFLKNLIGVAADLTSEEYRAYAKDSETGGKLFTLFYVMLAIGFLYGKQFISIEDREEYDTYLNMLLFGALIYVAVVGAGLTNNLMRFAFYFTIASCYAWPLLLKHISGTGSEFIIKAVFIVGHLIYYYIMLPKRSITHYYLNEAIQEFFS